MLTDFKILGGNHGSTRVGTLCKQKFTVADIISALDCDKQGINSQVSVRNLLTASLDHKQITT